MVREIDGRFLTVLFPRVEREVTLSSAAEGLTRLDASRPVRAPSCSRPRTTRKSRSPRQAATATRLSDGREVDDASLWPLEAEDTPIERLAQLRLDGAKLDS